MQGGRLDRRIDVERRTITQDEFGQETETWAKLAERRAASVSPVQGDERFTAQQFVAKQQVEFRIRWANSVADVNPLDRIVYPLDASESPAQPPAEHQLYDIIEVSEIGRREGLRIIAARRAEVVNA